MLNLSTEQKVFNIGGVEFGGQPGERPTVLIGSIFFAGHRIVTDPIKGTFDKAIAKALLENEAEIAAATGNPRCTDVIGDTAEALIRYIEFVAKYTSSPILIDSPSQKVRLAALKYFAGSSLISRLIYNAIAEDYTIEELDCIRDCGLKSAVILAYTARTTKPAARLRFLQDTLLPAATQAGIENLLIDAGVN